MMGNNGSIAQQDEVVKAITKAADAKIIAALGVLELMVDQHKQELARLKRLRNRFTLILAALWIGFLILIVVV